MVYLSNAKEHYRELRTNINKERYVIIREYSKDVLITPTGNTWIRTKVEVFMKDDTSKGVMYIDRPQASENVANIVNQLKEDPNKLDVKEEQLN